MVYECYSTKEPNPTQYHECHCTTTIPFFQEEEEKNLKPLILKDVPAAIQMDISTISRIVSNKSVQTKLGIYPLIFIFKRNPYQFRR